MSGKPIKLYPTLRVDVMSLRILCEEGQECACWCQFVGKYAYNYEKEWLKCRQAGVEPALLSWVGNTLTFLVFPQIFIIFS